MEDKHTDLTRLGSSSLVDARKQTWVQTDRAVHEAWAQLCQEKPRAAALLHIMVAHMDKRAALVASRETLAALAKCSTATIKRSVAELKEGRWIQSVQMGGKGGVNAYVINSRVAWADDRKHLAFAAFSATVIASATEQDNPYDDTPLRRIPTLYPGERQLPQGPGEPPPLQPELAGMESDPPALQVVDPVSAERRLNAALRNVDI